MKKPTQNIILGVAILVIPFSSLVVGSYLLYKGIKNFNKQEEKKDDTERNV